MTEAPFRDKFTIPITATIGSPEQSKYGMGITIAVGGDRVRSHRVAKASPPGA